MIKVSSKLILFLLLAMLLVSGCSSANIDTQRVKDADVNETENDSSNLEEDENSSNNEGEDEGDEVEESTDESQYVSDIASLDPNSYVRVIDYIPDVIVDLKYATNDNFTGTIIYDFSDAYLRAGTVAKLIRAADELRDDGYRIKIWDAYRPFEAQKKLWEVYPNGTYVANPAYGPSGHNLGHTIDMTITDLDCNEVNMPTAFDDFSTLADRDYSDVDEESGANAKYLEDVMTRSGFKGYSGEWWDYSDTDTYSGYDDFYPAT